MGAPAKSISPSLFLVRGFLSVIIIGAFLLTLPWAVYEGRLPFIDALFTATSAVCVTGLVVVDTGTVFTPLGQTVILLLIFVGSLGFMAIATLLFVLMGRQITLRDRLIIQEAMNTDSIQGMVVLILSVIKLALLFQLLGAVLLSIRFVPLLGWSKGLFYSLFHAVSAFGNAGFDLMGNFRSLSVFAGDPLIMMVVAFLFIIGGLGFTVIIELKYKQRFSDLTLHTKMVLLITGGLLAVGTLCILALEFSNPGTIGSLDGFSRVLAAFFTAATPRTAGFYVVPTDLLRRATLFFLLFLMFVGASPASTGGGIKTTTFGTLFLAVIRFIRGEEETVILERKLPPVLLMRSLSIIFVSVTLIFVVIFVLTLTEDASFLAIVFEVFSAFGTAGLSLGITPGLSTVGKGLIILTMFTGRLGPLTLAFALARRRHRQNGIRYPEERVMIG